MTLEFAEALTDATRSLDRSRRRLEALLEQMAKMQGQEENTTRLRGHIVTVQQINNSIRTMGDLK